MTYEELRPSIQTGDILGVHGRGLVSDVIELFTGNRDKESFSHVAVFYWQGVGLWLAQEYEGVGFGCYPASQLIAKFMNEKKDCYWGKAPETVSSKPASVMDLISTYRRTPSLQPYGYGSLIRVLFDEKIDPTKVQAVCSIFAQQAWEATGYTFTRLYSPENFKSVVTDLSAIQ